MSGGSSERVARATGQSEARAGVAGWGAVASPGAAVEGRLRGCDDFLPAVGSSQGGGFSSGMAEFWKQSQSEMPWMEEEERRILEFCLGNGGGEARSAGRSGVQREEEMQTYFWP